MTDYLGFGKGKEWDKILNEIAKQPNGRFLTRNLEKMLIYLLNVKTPNHMLSIIAGSEEDDLVRETREFMLRDIQGWTDEAIQISTPFLNVVVPLLMELRDIMRDQVRTRKLKTQLWKE